MNAAQLREVADQMQSPLKRIRDEQELLLYNMYAPQVRGRLREAAGRGLYEVESMFLPELMIPELTAEGFVILPRVNNAHKYSVSWKGVSE